jgi:hypothetical protein
MPITKLNDSESKEGIYKYVPHHRQRAYEDLGWVFASYLGYPHAAYASLYKWEGEGYPVEPADDITVIKQIDMEIKDDEYQRE